MTIKKLRRQISSRNRRVRRENLKFSLMSASEKRVRIAQDVIKYLDSKKLLARTGSWIQMSNKDGDSKYGLVDEEVSDRKQLKNLLPEIEACTACALGGLFYSTVMCANELTVGEVRRKIARHEGKDSDGVKRINIGYYSIMTSYLKKFFSVEQLELVEAAFEKGSGAVRPGYFGSVYKSDPAERLAASRMFRVKESWGWGSDQTTSEERLRVIMKNIIDNKGKFVVDIAKADG